MARIVAERQRACMKWCQTYIKNLFSVYKTVLRRGHGAAPLRASTDHLVQVQKPKSE